MASNFSQKFESLGKMPRWPIVNKGGRPPKKWPSSGRRLLVRYATAAYQNFNFIGKALEGSDFTVRYEARRDVNLYCADGKSVRHVNGKIRELFGSRKVGDDGYDAKLRPRNSDEMNQRIRAFVECKEQWYMLKRRAVMQSKASPNGVDSCQTNLLRREDLIAKSPGLPNSDASVDFDFTSGIDIPMDCNSGGIDLPIDYNPGVWAELNGGCFSSADGGCVSDQVHNSLAGSLTSAKLFADLPQALQRRARNRKNQQASRMC